MIAQKRRNFLAKNGGWNEALDGRVIAAVCAALVLLRMAYLVWISPYGLAPDEAQYWTWLSHNGLSFLTKPPLTTWLMGISTFVLGDTLVGVKFFALLGQVGTAALAFYIARLIGGRAAGWWAFALVATVPLVAVGGLIMSPDAVLLPLWMGALYVLVRMVKEKRQEDWKYWILLGILVGLAGLAKYSAAFFYPLLGLFLLVERPAWLKRPQVWVSGLVALAFQAPVLIWNIQHGWVGAAHVLWQADGGGDGRHGGIGSLGDLLGSQLLVVGPVVFAALLSAWVWRVRFWSKTNALTKLLVVFTLPIFLGFAALTVHSKVQANWPLLAMVPGLVLLAVRLPEIRRKALVYLAVGGVVLNAVLGVILLDTAAFRAMGMFPLAAKNDPTKDMRGWVEMGQLFGLVINKLDNPLVLSTRYQTLAGVAFHTPNHPEMLYLNAEGRRMNEYDLWKWPELERRIVVYVSENNRMPELVKERFQQCEPWHSLGVEEHGEVARRLWLWVCWNPAMVANRL